MEEGLNFQNVVYEACQMHFGQSIELHFAKQVESWDYRNSVLDRLRFYEIRLQH